MAKKDFDKYLKGLRLTVGEDAIALGKMKEALALGETDEVMVKSAETAFKADKYRMEIFLFAKCLLDRPTRKKKVKSWIKQNTLPTEIPERQA